MSPFLALFSNFCVLRKHPHICGSLLCTTGAIEVKMGMQYYPSRLTRPVLRKSRPLPRASSYLAPFSSFRALDKHHVRGPPLPSPLQILLLLTLVRGRAKPECRDPHAHKRTHTHTYMHTIPNSLLLYVCTWVNEHTKALSLFFFCHAPPSPAHSGARP